MVLKKKNKKIGAYLDGGYNFVDVRDVADGIIKAAEKGKGVCAASTKTKGKAKTEQRRLPGNKKITRNAPRIKKTTVRCGAGRVKRD